MNTYAVDQCTVTFTRNPNGGMVLRNNWATVLQIDAPRTGSALRIADAKWPGRLHRARLIRCAVHPAPLCADDRELIHQLTTQTI